jgi:hypothetical protein
VNREPCRPLKFSGLAVLLYLIEYKSLSVHTDRAERVDLADVSDKFDDSGPPTRDDPVLLICGGLEAAKFPA